MRILTTCALALALAGSLHAASYWENRGDQALRAGKVAEAIQAYERALGADPTNEAILRKYEAAFLRSFEDTSKVRMTGASRMGRPRAAPAAPAAGAAPASPGPTSGEAEGQSAPATPSSTGEAEDEGVRVRKDGVVELDFKSLLRPVTRLGGARRRPGEDTAVEGEGDGEGGDPDEPPPPKVYGSAEVVDLGRSRQGFEGTDGEAVETENVRIRSANYEIFGVQVAYDRQGDLHIKGRITNNGGRTVRLPRVYCRIFDAAGVLRGRSYSYVTPGRNALPAGKTKSFDVEFRGYREPVSSYRFEVVP